MKTVLFALAFFALAPVLPAHAQTPLARPVRIAAPGSNVTFDGIGANLPLSSISFSARNSAATATSGAGTGKVNISELTLVRNADEASTDLFLNCATGRRIKSVVLKSGGFTITLSDVVITTHQFTTDANGAFIETLTLWFPKIQIISPGNKTMGWDTMRNSKV